MNRNLSSVKILWCVLSLITILLQYTIVIMFWSYNKMMCRNFNRFVVRIYIYYICIFIGTCNFSNVDIKNNSLTWVSLIVIIFIIFDSSIVCKAQVLLKRKFKSVLDSMIIVFSDIYLVIALRYFVFKWLFLYSPQKNGVNRLFQSRLVFEFSICSFTTLKIFARHPVIIWHWRNIAFALRSFM